VKEVGQYLIGRLEKMKPKFPSITDIRGRGLLVAIEFKDEIAQLLVESCLERGLLVNKLKPNAIRFIPPLIIGKKEVDEALDMLDKALVSVTK
jgi:acetylornithine/N-succinyldiaminopimelate aminotransferase